MTNTAAARQAKTDAQLPIHAALSNVMDAVRSVRKTDQNQQQGFRFRGVDAVVNAVGPALRDHGVIVMPEVLDQQYGTVEVGRNRTPMGHVQVKVRYTFTGPAGDSMSCVVVAEAMDSGDKHLSLDTPIPTPTGWTTMGLIEPGDLVIDMHGAPVRVVRKSDTLTGLPCYRITFRNGQQIECSGEHEWWAHNGKNAALRVWRTDKLAQRKASGAMVTMPHSPQWQTPDVDLPVDPWLLGYWLGNGSSSSGSITVGGWNGEYDADDIRAMVTSAGYVISSESERREGTKQLRIAGLSKQLADLGVLGNKHVPAAYLRGSHRQRLALLRGLMDSDGSAAKNGGTVLFVSTDPEISAGVLELARTLGEHPNMWSQPAHGFGVDTTAHRVKWRATINPFSLPRKARNVTPREKRRFHAVQSIERIDSLPVACIGVDSATSSYLCGESMIPTHNCTPKAMSVALRTALLQALCLPTDEPDPDSQSYERSPASVPAQRQEPTLTQEDIALAKSVAVQAATCGDVDKIRGTWAEADARGYLDVDVTSVLNAALAAVVGVSSPVTLKAWLTGVGKWVAANGGLTVADAVAAQAGAE